MSHNILPAISEGEGLARWFDLCENEDAGKNEHKTDGGVEQDVFNTSVQDHGPEVENEESQVCFFLCTVFFSDFGS